MYPHCDKCINYSCTEMEGTSCDCNCHKAYHGIRDANQEEKGHPGEFEVITTHTRVDDLKIQVDIESHELTNWKIQGLLSQMG